MLVHLPTLDLSEQRLMWQSPWPTFVLWHKVLQQDKRPGEMRDAQGIPQYNTDSLHQTHSQHQPKWKKKISKHFQ